VTPLTFPGVKIAIPLGPLGVNLESKDLTIQVANAVAPSGGGVKATGSTVVTYGGAAASVTNGSTGVAFEGLDFVDAPHYSVDTSVPSAEVAYPYHFNSGTVTSMLGGRASRPLFRPWPGILASWCRLRSGSFARSALT
jgi:hypothetical protein